MAYELVVIGVSAGGLNALCELFGALPRDYAQAVVVIQHRSKESDQLCEVLADCSTIPVQEVTDKEPIVPGRVYLAPADYHLLIEADHLALDVDAPEMYSRPSIDVAFESAALSFGDRLIGIVMTGANHDGSRGLREIADRGGVAIVQDPETAEVKKMPRAALEAVPEAEVLPLGKIAARLVELGRTRMAS